MNIVTASITYYHPSREIPTPVAILNSPHLAWLRPEPVDVESGVWNITITDGALESLQAEGEWTAQIDRFWIEVTMP